MVFFTKESMYGAIVLVLSFLDRVFDILLATEPFKLLTLHSFNHMRKCKQQQ